MGFHDIPCSIFLLFIFWGCERTWARQVWVYICQASVKWHWSKKQLLSFPVYPSNISCKHLPWKINMYQLICWGLPSFMFSSARTLVLGSIYYLQFGSCPNTRLIKVPHENSEEWISQFTGFWQPPIYHLHALTPSIYRLAVVVICLLLPPLPEVKSLNLGQTHPQKASNWLRCKCRKTS